MSNNSSNNSGGIGLCGFVFLIFLFLKLAEIGVVATWSWWWVTAPLWIPFTIVFSLLAILLTIGGISAMCSARSAKKAVKKWGRNRRW